MKNILMILLLIFGNNINSRGFTLYANYKKLFQQQKINEFNDLMNKTKSFEESYKQIMPKIVAVSKRIIEIYSAGAIMLVYEDEILYIDSWYDFTEEIIRQLNEEYANEKV